jgi:cation/acetate symporter
MQIDAAIANEKTQADAKKKEISADMPKPIFPMKNPTVISLGLAFVIGILVSLLFPEKEAESKYEDEELREYIGIGAE